MNKKRIAGIVIASVIGFIILVNTIFGIINFKNDNPITLFGLKVSYVSTDAMEPNLKYRAFIIVKECDYNTIKVNDTIDFKVSDGDFYETSKVRQITEDGLVIRGDAETMSRDYFVTENELYGKVIFKLNISANFLNEIGTFGGVIKWIVLPAGCITLFVVLKKTISRKIEENKVIYNDDDDDDSLKRTSMLTRYNNSARYSGDMNSVEAGWRSMGNNQQTYYKNQYAEISERHAHENGMYDYGEDSFYDSNSQSSLYERNYDAPTRDYDEQEYMSSYEDYDRSEDNYNGYVEPDSSTGYNNTFSDDSMDDYEDRYKRVMGKDHEKVSFRNRNYDAVSEADVEARKEDNQSAMSKNDTEPEENNLAVPEVSTEENKEEVTAREKVILEAVDKLSKIISTEDTIPGVAGTKKPEYSIVIDFVAADEKDESPSIRVRMLDGDKNTMAMTTFNGDPKIDEEISGMSEINMRLVTPNSFNIKDGVRAPFGAVSEGSSLVPVNNDTAPAEGLKGLRLAMGSVVFDLEYSSKNDENAIDFEDYLYSYNLPDTD